MNGWKSAVAVCLILLAGSVYWNISMMNKNKTLTKKFDDNVVMLDEANNKLSAVEKEKSIVQNPNVRMALMKGMPQSPQSYATVYWDTTSRDVHLLVNNLPVPESGKQYQLWAIFNNKPVDMGVLDAKLFDKNDLANNKPILYKMKTAQNAQAFAITLEKMGGSPSPEGQMYVMGYL